MSRKDYIAFAAMFGEIEDNITRWKLTARAARLFAADNPNFDEERFRKAVEEGQSPE